MAEPTLSLTYNDLTGEVGFFAGWGRGAANGEQAWTTLQLAAIESCVRSGLRQFYYPPAQPGSDSPYDWSFLHPLASLSLAAAATTVALPDDFGAAEGQATVTTSANAGTTWSPLDMVGLGRIVQAQAQYPTTTGRPQMACIEPIKGTILTHGQRWQMRLWPVSDQAYTLQVQYYVNPDALTAALPYVYGGPQHAETVLESCLAIAEQRLDDQDPRKGDSIHTLKFQERLTASIGMDRKLKPQKLGYNGDSSDFRHSGRSRGRPWSNPVITYNGQGY